MMDTLEEQRKWAEEYRTPEQRFAEEFESSPFGKALARQECGHFLGNVELPEWVLENILPANSIGSVFGPPNGGKSHLVIDLAAAMAAGRTEWNGFKLEPGPVLYFAESLPHIEARFLGYNIKHGNDKWTGPERFPLDVLPPPGLNTENFKFFVHFLKQQKQKPKMIVFDTFMACIRSEKGDNDSETVASMMVRMQEEILPLLDNGLIVLIDHSSRHSMGNAIKGSISKDGAYDWTINVQFKSDLQATVARLDKDRWQKHDGNAHWVAKPYKVEATFCKTNGAHIDWIKDTVTINDWEAYSEEEANAQRISNDQTRKANRMKECRDAVFAQLRMLKVGDQKIYLKVPNNAKNAHEYPELDLTDFTRSERGELRTWILKNKEVLCHYDHNKNGTQIGIIITGINDSPF